MGSIRWRLAAAFAFVTLVAVGALGGLALGLVSSIAEHRALADVRGDAEIVAEQALPALAGVAPRADLTVLAHTSAFLGERRVRIFGPDHSVLVDTGSGDEAGHMAFMAAPEAGPGEPTFFMMHAPDSEVGGPGDVIMEPSDVIMEHAIPAGESEAKALRVQRLVGPGGGKLSLTWTKPVYGPLAPDPDVFAKGRLVPAPFEASPISVAVAVGDPNSPAGFVELSGGPDVVGETVATARRAITAAAGAATLLAAALGLVFSRSLTAPLGGLADAARRVESGDLRARAPVGGPTEIDSVARAFNGMAHSLEATVSELAADRDALSRFVADASHQLRTPITALSTYLEIMSARLDHDDPNAEFLRDSVGEVARLDWVTRNLLDLSRLESGTSHLLLEPVALEDLLSAAAAPYLMRAREQGTKLSVGADEGLTATCDRAHLEMAISNLVDNALKHCGTGDEVTLDAVHADGGIDIRVADTGPGFEEADLVHVFERFYRGSTSDHGPVPGAGIGLSVVASVAAAHGGSARAWNGADGGAVIAIHLPSLDESLPQSG